VFVRAGIVQRTVSLYKEGAYFAVGVKTKAVFLSQKLVESELGLLVGGVGRGGT